MADLAILRALSGGATAAASGIENKLIEALNRSDEDRRLQTLLEAEGRQETRTIAREDRASSRASEAAHDNASTELLSLGLGEQGLARALRRAGFEGNVEDATTSEIRSATAAGIAFQNRRVARQTAETEILNELDTAVVKGLVDPAEESRLRLIVAGTKSKKRRSGFQRLNRELTSSLGAQARAEQEAEAARAQEKVDLERGRLDVSRGKGEATERGRVTRERRLVRAGAQGVAERSVTRADKERARRESQLLRLARGFNEASVDRDGIPEDFNESLRKARVAMEVGPQDAVRITAPSLTADDLIRDKLADSGDPAVQEKREKTVRDCVAEDGVADCERMMREEGFLR